MKKHINWLLPATFLLLAVLLAACGDVTSTALPATTNAAATSTTAPAMTTMSMPTQTTSSASTTAAMTTMSMATQTATSVTTPAATTAAMTTMSMATTSALQTTMASMPGTPTMATPGNDPMTLMLKPLTGAAFEVNWMQMMIVHHQGAIDMAKLAKTNTKRAELTKLADDIITAQTKEIDQMTKWLAEWHNAKPLPQMAGMDHGGMAMPTSASSMTMGMADMSKLKTAKDAEFDKMFVAMMIEHHQQAVSMAALLPDKTKRTELLTLGQDIIKAQTSEIEQMTNWQKTWSK